MKKILFMLVVTAASLLSMNSCKEDEYKNPYEEILKEQLDYLETNSKREGIIVTTSGLQYEIITEGTGKSPLYTDKVRCHYQGSFIDGRVFDSSYKSEKPIEFSLMNVIEGWTEGLQYMKEGAKYRFYIPFYLGYGPNGYGSIPPYATLIFDVELIEVVK